MLRIVIFKNMISREKFMSKNQYFKLDMKERKLWKLTQNM